MNLEFGKVRKNFLKFHFCNKLHYDLRLFEIISGKRQITSIKDKTRWPNWSFKRSWTNEFQLFKQLNSTLDVIIFELSGCQNWSNWSLVNFRNIYRIYSRTEMHKDCVKRDVIKFFKNILPNDCEHWRREWFPIFSGICIGLFVNVSIHQITRQNQNR